MSVFMRTAVLAAPVLIAPLLVVAGPGQTASAAAQMCQGKPATIIGTAGKDTLRGTTGPDVIVGLARGDLIFGGGGNDIVCGGGGPDEIHGDAGNDRLDGQGDGVAADRGGSFLFGDVIDGGAGDDVLDVGPWAYASYARYPFGERIEFRDAPGAVTVDLTTGRAEGQGSDRIVRVRQIAVRGSDEADLIIGTPGQDRVESGPGDDHVDLGSGSDVWFERLTYDSGNDVVDGGDGYDELNTAGGQDTLTGGGDPDVIKLFGSGARSVDAGPGDDTVYVTGTDLAGVARRWYFRRGRPPGGGPPHVLPPVADGGPH